MLSFLACLKQCKNVSTPRAVVMTFRRQFVRVCCLSDISCSRSLVELECRATCAVILARVELVSLSGFSLNRITPHPLQFFPTASMLVQRAWTSRLTCRLIAFLSRTTGGAFQRRSCNRLLPQPAVRASNTLVAYIPTARGPPLVWRKK